MTAFPLIFSLQAPPDTIHLLGTAKRAKETDDLSPTSAPKKQQYQCINSGCSGNIQLDFWHDTYLLHSYSVFKQMLLVKLNAIRLVLY